MTLKSPFKGVVVRYLYFFIIRIIGKVVLSENWACWTCKIIMESELLKRRDYWKGGIIVESPDYWKGEIIRESRLLEKRDDQKGRINSEAGLLKRRDYWKGRIIGKAGLLERWDY